MTRDQAQRLLERYLEKYPILPAQETRTLERTEWLLGLICRAYAAGHVAAEAAAREYAAEQARAEAERT